MTPHCLAPDLDSSPEKRTERTVMTLDQRVQVAQQRIQQDSSVFKGRMEVYFSSAQASSSHLVGK